MGAQATSHVVLVVEDEATAGTCWRLPTENTPFP